MRVLLAIVFSLGYFVLAFFLGMELHQPRLMPHVMFGYAGAASGLLWWVEWVLRRTSWLFKTPIFLMVGFGLGAGLFLFGGSMSTALSKIEVARSARVASTTVVEHMYD